MKAKLILTTLLFTLIRFVFGQINLLDANGKKDGKWIVYLDKNWKKVEDSTSAIYFRYTYFDHGTNIYPMGPSGGKDYKLENDTKNKILNGEYKWYDGKGKLSSVHVFKDGEYVSCKEYFPTGKLSQHFDYTKKCEGQAQGWTVFIYDRKENLILVSAICKDKNGKWPRMRG